MQYSCLTQQLTPPTWTEYFDNTSENKLIYMDIFKEYINLIENFLESRLKACIEDFSMDELCRMIQEHEGIYILYIYAKDHIYTCERILHDFVLP
jgi:hypothetical protein